ncbi:Tyrosine-tRNA ligase, mitochondrial [Phlyctema vagabunda]|uniref:Tyrosine--tRNA ligase n=1 Tax=Phlyctema vagabunda TaxID=108571 RepID=A0ABR4P939_9HELO
MASPSLLRTSSRVRQNAYICASCTFRASLASTRILRRAVHQNVIVKDWQALKRWEQDAKEILAGKKQSTLSILEERGLVHTIAGKRAEVDELMTVKRVGAYVGIDPTAPSLHVGHLLPLMSLFWMFVRGHHSISLVGGATAKIGDPTDRLTTRAEQDAAVRTSNLVSMHYQLKRIWENVEVYGRKHGLKGTHKWTRELVNNATWMNKLTVMELLQVMGPGMRMGPMMARDTVKNKMANGDGMSFAEFTYPILQGWDWWHMYHTKGIQMQIGGADQYGNITAGIDAVKYVSKHHHHPDVRKAIGKHAPPIGFTVPLLTTSSGAKFGKSAGNAVWLDKAMTSSFDLYGFFLRTADADVGKYLKLFTFAPLDQIEEVVKAHMQSPKERKAQHLLAREFLEIIHGAEEAKAAELQHRLMFSKTNAAPRPASSFASAANGPEGSEFKEQIVLNNAPTATMKLPYSLIHTRSIGRILYAAGLASSSSEGHRLASQQSIYIGGHPGGYMQSMMDGTLTFSKVKLWQPEDTQKFLIGGKLLILRKGKHNIRTIEVVGDKEFVNARLSFPGWEDMDELKRWLPQPVEGAMRRERRLEKENRERMRLENEKADELADKMTQDEAEAIANGNSTRDEPTSGSPKAK